jgi:hypothetical protein
MQRITVIEAVERGAARCLRISARATDTLLRKISNCFFQSGISVQLDREVALYWLRAAAARAT